MRRAAFSARLERLRRSTCAPTALAELPPAISARLSPSLADRLARLKRVGARSFIRTTSGDAELASCLGGERVAQGVVRVVTRLPSPLRWGRVRVDAARGLAAAQLHALGLYGVERAADLLFLDTETTGLAGGTGTVAFMVGIARLQRQHVEITQWVLAGFSGEAAMLDALAAAAQPCAALVSYNGKAFDLPLLRTRMTLCARRDPFSASPHLDLLRIVRRLPRRGCPDLRLGSIESAWLGCERGDDLPGSAAPLAWRRWLAQADPCDLPGVLKHNRLDLLALIALASHVGDVAAGLFALPAPESLQAEPQ